MLIDVCNGKEHRMMEPVQFAQACVSNRATKPETYEAQSTNDTKKVKW